MRLSALGLIALLAGCGKEDPPPELPQAKKPPAKTRVAPPAPAAPSRLEPSAQSPLAPVAKAPPAPEGVPLERALMDLRHPNSKTRRAAAVALASMGVQATPAMAALLEVLQDKEQEVGTAAATALAAIGRPAVAGLSPLLRHPRPEVRFRAVWALLQLGPEGSDTVPALIAVIADPRPQVRPVGAEMHAAIWSMGSRAVPALVESLSHGSLHERHVAASTLGYLGAAAKEALPALQRPQADRFVQEAAATNYRKILAATRPIAEITAEIKHADPAIRNEALKQIAALGPKAAEAVPALIEHFKKHPQAPDGLIQSALAQVGLPAFLPLIGVMQTDNPQLARSAGMILPTGSLPAEQVVPHLVHLLEGPHPGGRLAALEVLGRMASQAAAAVPDVSPFLKSSDQEMKRMAIHFLGFTHSTEASLALATALNDPDLKTRQAVVYALSNLAAMGALAPPVRAKLREMLQDADSSIRLNVEHSLRVSETPPRRLPTTGSEIPVPSAPETEPLKRLLADLRSPDRAVRRASTFKLGSMGEEAKLAVPALIGALGDKDYEVAVAVGLALAAIGPPAVPDLAAMLARSPRDREGAAWILAQMGPAAHEAIPALVSVLGRNNELRQVTRALSAIGKPAVPALIEALTLGPPESRPMAADTLGEIGPDAEEALPALEKARSDRDSMLSGMATKAIGQIRPVPPRQVAEIVADLQHENDAKRSQAVREFSDLGPKAAEAIPSLLQILREGKAKGSVFWALRQIGPPAFLPILKLLQAPDAKRVPGDVGRTGTRLNAVVGLLKEIKAPDEAVPELGAMLRGGRLDLETIAGVLEILEFQGPRAASVVPEAVPFLNITTLGNSTRSRTVAFLGASGSRDAVRPLAEILKDSDDRLGFAAINALLRLDEQGVSLAPAEEPLKSALLEDLNPTIRPMVLRILEKIRTTQKPAAPSSQAPLAPAVPMTKEPSGLEKAGFGEKCLAIIPEGMSVYRYSFSPDVHSVAFAARSGMRPKQFVFVGEKKGEGFDQVLEPTFSPDGKTVAYGARKDRKWFIVVGDKKGEEFDGIFEHIKPTFSRDSKTVAYAASIGVKQFVVVGDKKREEFDQVLEPTFSPDGKTVAYGAKKEGFPWKMFVVVGEKKGEDFFLVGPPTFSPDGKTIAYCAGTIGKWCVVVGDKKGEDFDEVSSPTFSPDGKIVAYGAKDIDGKWFLVVGDKKMGGYYRVGKPTFSPDGKTVAYQSANAKGRFIVVGDKNGQEFDQVGPPTFSPDGKIVAYAARGKGGMEFVVVGEKKGEAFFDAQLVSVSSLTFSPDGRKVAYGVRIGSREYWRKVIELK